MTILSDKEIHEHIEKGKLSIVSFESSCLNPAGYDLRSNDTVTIEPGKFRLVATLESVHLGLGLLASLHIRSSLAREGVIGSFAIVDPGFRGQLTLNLRNEGQDAVTIRAGERVVQIIFHRLGHPARRGYDGAYQDSKGVVGSKRG